MDDFERSSLAVLEVKIVISARHQVVLKGTLMS